MNEITKSEYPCIPLNKDYEYYQGDSPDEVCSRCEYRENLYDFIQKQYNKFALLKCCEKNPKSEPHPEAIFVDKNDAENTLAIEVKSINKLHAVNERKNDLIARQHHSFDNRHLDEIGSVLLCALNNVLTSENHTTQKSILYYSFLCEHTHVRFNYDTKNKCTFKDIFLKVEKKEIKKIYGQLFNCFTEFYKSIIGLLSDKIGETNMSWDLLWEIKEIQYEIPV